VLLRLSRAFLVFAALAGSAHAGVSTDVKTAALTQTEVAVTSTAPDLAERVDTLITRRAAMMNQIAPQPAAGSADPKAIARRLAALRELDTFARTTINGLIDAAPSRALKDAMADELAPVLMLHEEDMATHLVNLLNLPLVQDQGWFVISRFGAQADHDAAQLLEGAAIDPAYKDALSAKMRALASRGETTPEAIASFTISAK